MNPNAISPGSKLHNAIVQLLFIAGLLNGLLPQLAAITHVPAWVSLLIGAFVKIGNEFLDDEPARPADASTTPPPDRRAGFVRPQLLFIGFAAALLAGGLMFSATGCATKVDPAGVYAGDTVLYKADLGEETTYQAIAAFLKWELSARATQKNPEVKAKADYLRANAPRWFQSYATLRAAYVANPTPGNRASLEAALTDATAVLTVVSQYVAPPSR